MGGYGSGGARVGAGRKKKDLAAKMLHGTATRRERKRGRKSKTVAVPAVPMPDDLDVDERKAWRKLAPHAIESGTLTPGTAIAFRHLCEAIVLKRQMLAEIKECGLSSVSEHGEIKANPLLSQYRTMLQRVEAGMTRFMLSPIGKSVVPDEEPDDPFSAFDEDDDDDAGSASTH